MLLHVLYIVAYNEHIGLIFAIHKVINKMSPIYLSIFLHILGKNRYFRIKGTFLGNTRVHISVRKI